MAEKCGNCGSADTGAMLNTFTCHACGAVTDYDGTVVRGPSTVPGVVAPPVVTVSPASSNEQDATRTVTTTAPGDTVVSTETVPSNDPTVAPVGAQPPVDEGGNPREAGEGQQITAEQPGQPDADITATPTGETAP